MTPTIPPAPPFATPEALAAFQPPPLGDPDDEYEAERPTVCRACGAVHPPDHHETPSGIGWGVGVCPTCRGWWLR